MEQQLLPNGMIIPATISTNQTIPAVVWSQDYLQNPYEVWTSAVSYKEDTFINPNQYLVSNLGNVYDLKLSKYVTQIQGDDGYIRVALRCNNTSRSSWFVAHRLMMYSFLPIDNVSEYHANHINCIRNSNELYNISWCTPSQNVLYARDMGNLSYGEDHYAAKITEEQAHEICRLISQGDLQYKEIAELMKVPEKIVMHISQRECWTYVSKYYTFPKRLADRFTEDEVRFICQSLQDKGTSDEVYQYIADSLNYELDKKLRRKLDAIRYGENFKEISKDYNIPVKTNFFTDEQVHTICQYFEKYGTKRDTQLKICELFGWELDKVLTKLRGIIYRKAYKEIVNMYNF